MFQQFTIDTGIVQIDFFERQILRQPTHEFGHPVAELVFAKVQALKALLFASVWRMSLPNSGVISQSARRRSIRVVFISKAPKIVPALAFVMGWPPRSNHSSDRFSSKISPSVSKWRG
jgi:hypothetical protein